MIHRAFGRTRRTHEPPSPPDPLDLAACYRYCEALARTRHHNFPVASRFLPEALRKHIFAIYAFVRTADDFVDEPEFSDRRSLELDRWEQHLYGCYHRESSTHPVFAALADT